MSVGRMNTTWNRRMADDRRLVLAVAGAAHLVAGRLQELDDAVVEVSLRGDGKPDGVDRVR